MVTKLNSALKANFLTYIGVFISNMALTYY